MPHGARTSLAALMLILGIGGASAESVATTWTDPPAHKAASPKAPGRRARSRSAAAVSAALSPGSSGGKRTGRRLSGSTSAKYSSSVPW